MAKEIILRKEDVPGQDVRVFLELKDGDTSITAAMATDADRDNVVDRVSIVGDLDGDNDLDEDDKALLRDMVNLFLKIKW
ncbi:Uncharacterised protein [Serratia quinivorans]|uniref:Uncharacterized protein n=1 Tax=Serratia quinivorans TaxID=137545 RepID=A0A380AJ77_9GAMM|nr:hypothetical protein [Serratia proteamaculans]RYM57782.1 hypothetical protein BSR03_23565 [Serratia proteamaculans]SUI82044.1 Uncharacterised protein [Serratia quinivorans]